MVQIMGPPAPESRGRKKIFPSATSQALKQNSSKVRGKTKPFRRTSCAPALQTELARVADAAGHAGRWPALPAGSGAGDNYGLPRCKPTFFRLFWNLKNQLQAHFLGRRLICAKVHFSFVPRYTSVLCQGTLQFCAKVHFSFVRVH